MRRLVSSALVFALLATTGTGAPQRTRARGKAMSDSQVLPFEADSRSELLSARTIFSIEVESLSGSPWAPDPDTGLEARVLKTDARLLHVYKGAAQSARPFQANLPQRREDALTVSDFHGFWSHQEMEPGKQYVLFSNGVSTDPAALMADTSMADLRPATPALAAEIALAVDVERRFAPVDSREKLIELFKILFENRDKAGGVFGRYACARIAPHFAAFEDAVQTGLMRVVTAERSTDSLRAALVQCLYDESAEQEITEQRAINLVRRLLSWAEQPEAAPMLDQMLEVYLYNLIFRPGEPPLPVDRVVPERAERESLAKIFSGHPSQRAGEIIAWLR